MPVTRVSFLDELVASYELRPSEQEVSPILMHPLFVRQRTLLFGLLPLLIALPFALPVLGYYILLLLLWPLLVALLAWRVQKKIPPSYL